MNRRLFDHIDLRVRDLQEARPFYGLVLPALGFPDAGDTPLGIAYDAVRDHRKPEFVGLIEDRGHVPNATRLAFWAETKAEVDRIAGILDAAGARNVEGPMFCPEYSSTYYAVFFEDPCGNRLEVCCRTATAESDNEAL
jgi:catechol 2,3-dioxygenase-like lactoylglutathione lyase family enzyme